MIDASKGMSTEAKKAWVEEHALILKQTFWLVSYVEHIWASGQKYCILMFVCNIENVCSVGIHEFLLWLLKLNLSNLI